MAQAFTTKSLEEAYKMHEKAVDDVLKQKMKKLGLLIKENPENKAKFGNGVANALIRYADGKISLDELDYILNRCGIILDFVTPNFKYKKKFGNNGEKLFITGVKDKEVIIQLYVGELKV